MLLYEEMIPAAPHVELVEEEIRFKPEKKFLSYAAVASPDGQSYNAHTSLAATTSNVPIPAKDPTRPSFADKVKASSAGSNANAASSPPSELEFRNGKRGTKFVNLSGGGGGRTNY